MRSAFQEEATEPIKTGLQLPVAAKVWSGPSSRLVSLHLRIVAVMQLRAAVFAAIALCLALLLVQTDAWGKEGHQIVADIAYNRLNSNAQQVCLTPLSFVIFFFNFSFSRI